MKKTLTYLIVTIAFIAISGLVMAQGGGNPLVNSTHGYKVIPGDSENHFLWEITGGTEDVDYVVNSANLTGDSLNITWLSTTGNPYKLTFKETDTSTGCETSKELTLNVVANTFDVSISNPVATCNSANDTTDASNNFSIIDFTVNMTTGSSSWNPNWEITFNVASGNVSSTVDNVSSATGTLNDNGGGSYTLTDIPSSSLNNEITISVRLAGAAFTELSADVNITEAKELEYNTPDKDNDDWTAAGIINPIPNTSAIITD